MHGYLSRPLDGKQHPVVLVPPGAGSQKIYPSDYFPKAGMIYLKIEIQAAADQAADIVKQAKAYGVATFYWMSIFDGEDRNVPQWTLPTVVDAMQKAYNK